MYNVAQSSRCYQLVLMVEYIHEIETSAYLH